MKFCVIEKGRVVIVVRSQYIKGSIFYHKCLRYIVIIVLYRLYRIDYIELYRLYDIYK